MSASFIEKIFCHLNFCESQYDLVWNINELKKKKRIPKT